MYIINFDSNPLEMFAGIDSTDRKKALKKLYKIVTSEYREPSQWDWKPLHDYQGEGRLRIGNGLRVFASIDQENEILTVHRVARRENLY